MNFGCSLSSHLTVHNDVIWKLVLESKNIWFGSMLYFFPISYVAHAEEHICASLHNPLECADFRVLDIYIW